MRVVGRGYVDAGSNLEVSINYNESKDCLHAVIHHYLGSQLADLRVETDRQRREPGLSTLLALTESTSMSPVDKAR